MIVADKKKGCCSYAFFFLSNVAASVYGGTAVQLSSLS